jgi:hypothetical protein
MTDVGQVGNLQRVGNPFLLVQTSLQRRSPTRAQDCILPHV